MTDPRGNDPSFVPPNGDSTSPARYTTTFTFDYEVGSGQCGRIVRKQEPTVRLPDSSSQSIITEYMYNQFCQVISETDPEGNVDEFFYFPNGGYLSEKLIDSTGARISNRFFYDPVGNIIRTIDGRGNDTLYTVNQLNQVVRMQAEEPFRYITDTFYDFNDNVVQTSIENKVASEADGKPVFTGDGNFNTQAGNPAFFVHRYTHDILDNLVQKDEDATGSTPSRLITQYRYDANENRIQEIFPEGNIFVTVYDERDLLFTRTRGFGSPQASTFTYNYDRNRNLVLLLDGEGSDPTTYQFNGFDRQIGVIDAVGNRASRNYDPHSNVVKESRFGPCGGSGPTNVLLSQRESKHDELNRIFQQDDLLSSPCPTMRTPVLTEGLLTPGDGKSPRVTSTTATAVRCRRFKMTWIQRPQTMMVWTGSERPPTPREYEDLHLRR